MAVRKQLFYAGKLWFIKLNVYYHFSSNGIDFTLLHVDFDSLKNKYYIMSLCVFGLHLSFGWNNMYLLNEKEKQNENNTE